MNKRILTGWLLAASALGAQTHDLWQGVGLLDSGVTIHYRTVHEPALKNSAFLPVGGAFGVNGNTMQHAIYDREARSYFGYDLTVRPGEAPHSLKVVVGPLNLDRIRESLKAVAGDLPLSPAQLPKYPPPQLVYNGDTIAMDLMVSPDGREHIVDYIEFSFGQKTQKPPEADTSAPQTFTLDDGPVHADPNRAEVSIDGRKFDGYVICYAPRGGATLWIYLPGRGRYLLSLAPHEGFAKTGVVRGRKISFAADGHQYEIRLGEPLAGSEKAWNLYTFRDAAFLPLPAIVNAVVMGADRLENLR